MEKGSKSEKMRRAIERFCELDRMGMIEHDWSRVRETGKVYTRIKLDDIKPAGDA